jgi:hypothetical protein
MGLTVKTLMERSHRDAVRELCRLSHTMSPKEFENLVGIMENAGGEYADASYRLVKSFKWAKDVGDELASLVETAPAVARRALVNYSRTETKDRFDSIVAVLDDSASVTRDNNIAELAEYAEKLASERR